MSLDNNDQRFFFLNSFPTIHRGEWKDQANFMASWFMASVDLKCFQCALTKVKPGQKKMCNCRTGC